MTVTDLAGRNRHVRPAAYVLAAALGPFPAVHAGLARAQAAAEALDRSDLTFADSGAQAWLGQTALTGTASTSSLPGTADDADQRP